MAKKPKTVDKLKALVQLIRPLNALMAGAAVTIALLAGAGLFADLSLLIPAILTAIFVAAGGNALNDYYDIEIDKINRPDRPLPSGVLSLRSVWTFSVLMFAVGIAFSFLLPFICIIIAVVNTGLLAWYASQVKKTGFFGNLMISYLVGSLLVFGAAAVGNLVLGIFLGICAFFTNASREIIKDLEDIRGDEQFGAKTLPMVEGKKKTIFLTSSFLLMTILLSPLPYLLEILSIYYMIVAAIADGIFLAASISLFKKPTITNAKINQRKIKFGAIIGLLAFLAGLL